MALYDTIKTYNGDGVTSDFAITFPYDDISELVVARKNGAVTWFLLNPSLLRITSPAALAVGDVLTIQRNTSIDSPKVIWKNGAGVTATQLNSIFTQFFRALNETKDVAFRALTLLASGVFDAVNARITNLGAPTASSDAARLADVQAAQITAGNVPTPVLADVGKVIEATGVGAFGWTAKGAPVDGSITPAKLSTGGPSWNASGDVTRTGDDFGPAPGTIASAATTSIFAQKADAVTVSGAVTITSFGTGTSGKIKFVTFSGAPLLTHSASLDVPGNANFQLAAGDVAIVQSLGGTNSKVLAITRDTGLSIVQYTPTCIRTVYTSGSGTHNFNANTKRWRVRGVGGGGAGGGVGNANASEACAGNGGGAGGFFEHLDYTDFTSKSYAVGAAGAGASGAQGGAGGNTTFGSITANGGSGGAAGASGSSAGWQQGVATGGSASGANLINAPGSAGFMGWRAAGLSLNGRGGDSLLGAGAPNAQNITSGTSVTGAAATGYGGGGSGAQNVNKTTSGTQAGGNGGSGVIIVEEYY